MPMYHVAFDPKTDEVKHHTLSLADAGESCSLAKVHMSRYCLTKASNAQNGL